MRPAEPAAAPRRGGSEVAGLAVVLLSVVMLSSSSTLVKSAHAPGAVLGFCRLAISALTWQAYLLARRKHLSWAAWRATAIPGICFGLNITLFFTGIPRTRVANAEFIGTLSPLFIVPFAASRLGEEVRRRTVVLGAAALGGVSLVVLFSGKGGTHSWVGDAMCMAAIAMWVSYLLTARHVRQGLDTATFMGGMSTWAALTLLPTALVTGGFGDLTGHAWFVAAALGLVAGVLAHGLLAWAQAHAPVSTISLIQLLQPALGTTWAFVFLGEDVRAVQVLGMAVVLVAVAAILRGAVRAAASEPAGEPADDVSGGTARAAGAGANAS